jgi:lipopolysaccharide export system permease protein
MKIPRPKTLDLYVLRRFFSIYGANLVSFTLLFVFIDAITHFEDFAKKTSGTWELLQVCVKYYAAITPLIFCQVLGPVVAVSAALFAVTTLQRTNEFTPILASGVSYQRTFVPVLVASFAISVCVFLIQEEWIPKTVSAIREAAQSRGEKEKAKHVKFLDSKYGNLLVFLEYERFHQKANGVDVIPIAHRGSNGKFIRAKSASWVSLDPDGTQAAAGYWLLHDATVQEYGPDRKLVPPPPKKEDDGVKPRLSETVSELRLETEMIPGDLELQRGEAVYMTLDDLRRKAETSPDQSGWYMKYFSRFAYPLTNFVLVLLGLPVIVHFGNRNIIFGAILAVAISTAYFVFNSVCQDFGIRGTMPVRVGAGLAPILFTAIGAVLYREMKS